MLDARRWKLPAEEIAALRLHLAGRREGEFAGVWPDNVGAVTAFLLAASQWRTSIRMDERRLRTVFVGLDYSGAKVAIDAAGIVLSGPTFAGLQVMEMAARDALNGEAMS
ncbi:DUF1799 domain-containing protein [Mesorhizobium australicum]|uniref:Uncharacterized protein n=1 Tax=Mesorhizobium australicum TaxID=536018 RepID=A0A1X7NXG5_9HYPH|nr:DUF1799 domain-containing protein [Mesorhizobium australicum]SMH42505.1 Phage related hypothetical protein [Mesorhizobium australicum]